MPNTPAYNQAYFKSHTVAIRARRAVCQARARTNPIFVARQAWLTRVLQIHHLTHAELATLLGVSLACVSRWCASIDTKHWCPIPDRRASDIARMLPTEHPMDATTLRHLGWSALRCAAYQRRWTSEIPEITPTMVREWRIAHGLSQQQLAETLGCVQQLVQHWEAERLAISAKMQEVLFFLMQGENKP